MFIMNLQHTPQKTFFAVVANSQKQALDWKEYFSKKPTIENEFFLFLSEEFEAGAGNGLGTLHAYSLAKKEAQKLYGINLEKELADGAVLALFHTAGQGMRLYPLPFAEQANKSRVLIPSGNSSKRLQTILEATIQESRSIVSSHKGRVVVFWADQLFFPKAKLVTPDSHIALFAQSHPLPAIESWEKEQWQQYGVIGINASSKFELFEKLETPSYKQLLSQQEQPFSHGFLKSLGAFSLSQEMLNALMNEFEKELQQNKGHFDTDIDFWMPMITKQEHYFEVVKTPHARKQYERMHVFLKKFLQENSKHPLFSVIDIGKEAIFWDLGRLSSYFKNVLTLLQSEELQRIFKLSSPQNSKNESLAIENSYLFDSTINKGKIKNSIVIGVTAESLDVENCVIINSQLSELLAKSCLIYKVQAKDPIKLRTRRVLVSVNDLLVEDSLDNAPKETWDKPIVNGLSYKDLILEI